MPEHAKVLVTDAEIDEALKRARANEKYDRRAVLATYSRAADCIRIALNDGATFVVPRVLIQGLATASPRDLARIEVLDFGTGLCWPKLNVAHYVPGLLQGVYGSEKWMAALRVQRQKPVRNGTANRKTLRKVRAVSS